MHGVLVGRGRRGHAVSVGRGMMVLDLTLDEFSTNRRETMGHRLLRYFAYEHLPRELQEVSRPFYELAHKLLANNDVTDTAERDVALRKLLEAKDAAVRSVLT